MKNKALIIDDTKFNRNLIATILGTNGIENIEATNGKDGLEKLEINFEDIAVITVDREMPIMNGMEFVKVVQENEKYKEIPVIFISSLSSTKDIAKGLRMGIYDYIAKPINPYLTYLKIKNAIELYQNKREILLLNKEIKNKNNDLEILVNNRTQQLQNMSNSLLEALENANSYNDESTGNHIVRVASYSEVIAKYAGYSDEFVHNIRLYASLHDIGKVGISDEILKKPGRYTKEEFDLMKEHVKIGYNMIKNSPLPEIAKNIVLYHHEKWNGEGYIYGLKEKQIPIEARIVAIADVFDALISKRVYKEKFTMEKTLEIMNESRGSHFDPDLFDVFIENISEIIQLTNKYKE